MTSEASGQVESGYGSALRTAVAASAAPYGYTLTIWTSGAVLSHARGIPGAGDALLFLAGAVAAYVLVAGRRLQPDAGRLGRLWRQRIDAIRHGCAKTRPLA